MLLLRWKLRGKGLVQGSLQREEGSENGKWTLKIYVLSPGNFEFFVLGHSENDCSSESASPGINNYWRGFSSFGLGHLHRSSDVVTERHSLGRAVRVTNPSRLCQLCCPGRLCWSKAVTWAVCFCGSRGTRHCRIILKSWVLIFFFFSRGKKRWNEVALPASGWIWNGLWVSPELY